MNTEITVRNMRVSDIEELITLRLAQLKEEGAERTLDLEPYLHDFYTECLGNKSFEGLVAVSAGKILATCGMTYTRKPPYYKNPTGKIGLLSNVYTLPEFRRQGIARQLVNQLLERGKQQGCGAIHITASNMGIPLYESCGFIPNEHFRQYHIE